MRKIALLTGDACTDNYDGGARSFIGIIHGRFGHGGVDLELQKRGRERAKKERSERRMCVMDEEGEGEDDEEVFFFLVCVGKMGRNSGRQFI